VKLGWKSFLERLSDKLRTAKLCPVLEALQGGNTVLDIGVWCDMPEPHPAENWLEKQALGSSRLIAVGLGDMRQFQEKYPAVWCVQADGMALPFKDAAVDVAVANAVLEHVPLDGREPFVRSFSRVVRQWGLISVPDRWCPVEIHSRIPFAHWFPFWRTLFRIFGKAFWASSDNLATLFTRVSLLSLLRVAGTKPDNWQVRRQTLCGVPISLLAFYKRAAQHLKGDLISKE
jgi:SAM-dependent methyltransferase